MTYGYNETYMFVYSLILILKGCKSSFKTNDDDNDDDDDDDDDDEIRFVSDQHALFCIFIVLTHWHDR